MNSTVIMVVWAILQTRPSMPVHQAVSYAKAAVSFSKKAKFHPLTPVAIIHHESHWRPSLVSRDGEDIGLGQIRARFIGFCRKDPSPVKNPSPECRAVRARLKTGVYNIKHVLASLKAWRKLCKKKTGKALLRDVLMGYGGLTRPRKGQWCGLVRRKGRWKRTKTPWVVRRILKRRRHLVREWTRCRKRCTEYRSLRSKLMRWRKRRR